MRSGVLRWLGIDAAGPDARAAGRQGFLACYAVASYVYRWLVVFWVFHLLFWTQLLAFAAAGHNVGATGDAPAGGFQPRAAVGYATVAALEVAAACGAGPRMGSEIDVAAEHVVHALRSALIRDMHHAQAGL